MDQRQISYEDPVMANPTHLIQRNPVLFDCTFLLLSASPESRQHFYSSAAPHNVDLRVAEIN